MGYDSGDPFGIERSETRIMEIMRELNIEYYAIHIYIGDDMLYDVLRVRIIGDLPGETAIASEFNEPAFSLLKELEVLAMGEES